MELPMKIGIGASVSLLLGILVGWAGFPALLHHKIGDQVALKNGSEMRDMYLHLPFPMDFKIYIFNVTNPDDVQKGDSPVLDEIGPFCYDEWKEKLNPIDDLVADTMIYTPRNTWIYNQTRSGKLTGDEIVTIPHPLIVGTGLMAQREKPSMLNLLGKALVTVYHAENVFLTAKVRDILFDGIIINCTVSDFAGKGLCGVMKNEMKSLEHISESVFKFSFFGMANGTLGKPFKVFRGVKNPKDVGRVVEFDGQKELSVWSSKKCNQFQGTDSTIFPPFLKEGEDLLSYTADICRSLPAVFDKNVVYKGIPVRKFKVDFGDITVNKEDACYCYSPEMCLKKGVQDLTKCIAAPIVASLPHFYLADESYVKGVRGLHPNERDHGIAIYFEPMTGTPLEARKRMQFSLPFQKIEKLALMKNIPEVLFPILWVEEGVELNATYVNQLKSELFQKLKIMKVVKWMIVLLSLVAMGAAGFLQYKKSNGFTVTPTYSNNENGKEPKKIISTVQDRF